MRYTVLLDPDPGDAGYTVTVPALRGCITEGRTIDEAIINAREAIACHIEGLLTSGDEAPREAPPLIPVVVEVELQMPTPALASSFSSATTEHLDNPLSDRAGHGRKSTRDRAVLSLRRAGGEPGDVVVDKEGVGNGDRDGTEDAGRHQGAPEIDVRPDEIADDPDGNRLHVA